MQTIIRDADMADVTRIAQIARLAYQPYVAAIGREPAPMCADFATLVARDQVRVATTGQVIGYVVSYASGPVWHLENIAVAPDIQSSGVGRMLIADVERRARLAGATAIDLYTNEKMTDNLTFYPRLGFTETGRAVQDGFHRVFFHKPLVGSAFAVDTYRS